LTRIFEQRKVVVRRAAGAREKVVDDLSRSFLASLRRSQWLTSRELALYQAPLIERLCRHAMMHTPFYRDRLRRLFDGGDGANGRFRVDRWSETPIFGRAEAQVAGSTPCFKC
jgi:hypothetical protein